MTPYLALLREGGKGLRRVLVVAERVQATGDDGAGITIHAIAQKRIWYGGRSMWVAADRVGRALPMKNSTRNLVLFTRFMEEWRNYNSLMEGLHAHSTGRTLRRTTAGAPSPTQEERG